MDTLIYAIDRTLRTLSGSIKANRNTPQVKSTQWVTITPEPLTTVERKLSASLMRVNHAGEVAAQALYQGQALFSRSAVLKTQLAHAADEEIDHLVWSRERVHELGGQTSVLDPVWYASAFVIGAVASVLGDKVSLSFLEATELQVEAHLASHLERLPANDRQSRAIVEQMKQDEAQHAQTARHLGANEMPKPIAMLMKFAAKIMTITAERI